jgi:hypothetical protein
VAAHVDLPHRFDPGSIVTLVKLSNERTLRAAGTRLVVRLQLASAA